MIRLDSLTDQIRDVVTYELPNGNRVCLSGAAVRKYGAAELLRSSGYADMLPTERVPVFQGGQEVGTVPPLFDPTTARSLSPLYDFRPGDFRREGAAWVADKMLGPGDLDAVPGFMWKHGDD